MPVITDNPIIASFEVLENLTKMFKLLSGELHLGNRIFGRNIGMQHKPQSTVLKNVRPIMDSHALFCRRKLHRIISYSVDWMRKLRFTDSRLIFISTR